MRLVVLSLFALAGTLYSVAAVYSYREEMRARDVAAPLTTPGTDGTTLPLHPEANLRRLRDAFVAEQYTDDLKPYLERALMQAPTFYQPPFLHAAFYANRLERPETIERSFEAAVTRFPSNGRLHLTYAEWLLTPRATAPYRSYRSDSRGRADDERERALHHLSVASTLEPDLVDQSIDLLLRFQIPMETWSDLLPDDERTRRTILRAADRAPRKSRRLRRELLVASLAAAEGPELLRAVSAYAHEWGEEEVALDASERWHRLALDNGSGTELTRSTLNLARECLDSSQSERAYRVLRDTLTEMEARGLASDSAELLVGMGDIYLSRRQLAMAQSLFTEAATRFPFHAEAYLGLAQTLQRAGDREAAIRELDHVLRLDPQNTQARSLLDALSERE